MSVCVLSVDLSISFPSPYRSVGFSGLGFLSSPTFHVPHIHIKDVCVPGLAMFQSLPSHRKQSGQLWAVTSQLETGSSCALSPFPGRLGKHGDCSGKLSLDSACVSGGLSEGGALGSGLRQGLEVGVGTGGGQCHGRSSAKEVAGGDGLMAGTPMPLTAHSLWL